MTKRARAAATVTGLIATVTLLIQAQTTSRYTAKQTGDIVQLQDTREQISVSVLATLSNAFEVQVRGQDLIRKTFATVDDFKARPGLNGVPLLAPFANRLDEPAFYANGKKYNFDMELGNVRGQIPIHGYLTGAKDWQVTEVKADANAAWVTSKLDFYRNPQYMKQFPFAHTLTMTYRLENGALEVRTRIDNLANEPMPVAIGFHPYFQLTDSSREDWTLSVGAKTHWLLNQNKVPTGETEPIEKFLPQPKAVALKDVDLDDVFSDLERDAQGRSVTSFKGKSQEIQIVLGPNYKATVLYSPNPANARGGGAGRAGAAPNPNPNPTANRGFMAIEPMAGITDSMNLAQKNLYKELQSVPPGGSWQESFWIRARGY